MEKTKRQDTVLQLTQWYPNFRFLSSVKYFTFGTKKISGMVMSNVCGYMWYRAQGKHQVCSASVGTIAGDLGVAYNTVRLAIDALKALKIIGVHDRVSEMGTNQYYVYDNQIVELHNLFMGGKLDVERFTHCALDYQ